MSCTSYDSVWYCVWVGHVSTTILVSSIKLSLTARTFQMRRRCVASPKDYIENTGGQYAMHSQLSLVLCLGGACKY